MIKCDSPVDCHGAPVQKLVLHNTLTSPSAPASKCNLPKRRRGVKNGFGRPEDEQKPVCASSQLKTMVSLLQEMDKCIFYVKKCITHQSFGNSSLVRGITVPFGKTKMCLTEGQQFEYVFQSGNINLGEMNNWKTKTGL